MANVVGLFDSSAEAQSTVQRLVNSGIDREQISLVSQDSKTDNAHAGTTAVADHDTSGALKGAGIGAALGGAGGILAGLAGLAIPVIGPIIAAGPIAAALAGGLGGAGLGAAAGGLIGALIDMGIPEDEAKHYQDQVGSGKTLVVVRTNDDVSAERAADILESSGAENVAGRDFGGEPTSDVDQMRKRQTLRDAEPDATDRGRGSNVQTERTYSGDRNLAAETTSDERNIAGDDTRTIPVTEEQLVVGKRAVQSGRVRIYGRETEKPVEDSVRLRSEHVNVERRSVDRPVSEADRSKEAVIEITEMKEEPVVGKQERVVEEIVVGKTAEEHTETVRDTVRRKDVEVERTDDAKISRDARRN